MRDNGNIEIIQDKKNETGTLRKSGRKSILDNYVDEIKMYIEMDIGLASIWKILSAQKLKNKKITYNGFYRYCKRWEL